MKNDMNEKHRLSGDEQSRLKAMIESDGDERVAEASGLSRQTIARAAAGLRIQAGSRRVLADLLGDP